MGRPPTGAARADEEPPAGDGDRPEGAEPEGEAIRASPHQGREARGETTEQRDERRRGAVTKSELYERARKRHIHGRSKMSKDQ